MKIGIMGAGTVGISLGKALTQAGYEVMFSVRDPRREAEKVQTIKQETGAQAGTVQELLATTEVIAVLLRWEAVPEVAKLRGWENKIVIDLTTRPSTKHAHSAAEELARLTGARVVKAFNTIGAEHYLNPVIDGQAVTMFMVGDDVEAKDIVGDLATTLGFEVIDAGDLSAAAYLDNLAAFWTHLSKNGLGRNIAFKLLQAEETSD